MLRSLWTGATGMNAQQLNLDTISNNLANVNTVGYKSQTNEFKSLLYQTLQVKTTSANGETKPGSAQVGLGVRNAAMNSIFTQGTLQESASTTAFAIEGDGFFAVRGADGNTYYTRNGDFVFTTATDDRIMLATSDGNPVVDTNGKPIILDSTYTVSNITVTGDGTLCYPDEKNNPAPIGFQLGIFQFANPIGLEKTGNTLFAESAASGAAINESTATGIKKSKIIQGYLESSNVDVATEMVNMIVTQRAYELNSKAITTSDTMLEQANNLKR